MLILVEHSINLVLVGRIENFIEVSSHLVLLIMESIEVYPFDGVNVHGHQLSESTPIEERLK